MTTATPDEIRTAVRDRYADAARAASTGDGPTAYTRSLYPEEQRDQLPEQALTASLGCGNPTLLAQLQPGQTVLDLGSGGGIDVLLSARRVGATGKAYGLDMTEEMLELARRNAAEAKVPNVEFLNGQIEAIPLPDASVDVIISNCVINLSADKDAVFAEAFRVLRPGGRLAISDIVLTRALPEPASRVMALWTGCVAGALVADDYRHKLCAAGFTAVELQPTQVFHRDAVREVLADADPGRIPGDIDIEEVTRALAGNVTSSFVRAVKPIA
ncbi:SAM-dependent methyltransferase [Actinoplanes octamycinicus]|uniref:Arsenite methyltransferase n=1 Tax=Actinoplanes octamycinicus TaxID=135948 RepID=A0A7W7H2H7_9ACTN|nr:arsenite methyltransferase [Actinoplanes octamycinicus]MBB4742796.1 SAM-dependent methyltransferase [Actinoplanes octamycinicus]GIE58349.1 arsenite S-adenosylmethyltransferase [Actinoplanes octamycinicus]